MEILFYKHIEQNKSCETLKSLRVDHGDGDAYP